MADRLRARLRALDNGDKQILFVIGGILALGNLAAIAVAVITGDLEPAKAALFIDALIAALAGLIWTAGRLFPPGGGEMTVADQTSTVPTDAVLLNRLRAYLDTYPRYPHGTQGDPEAMIIQNVRAILNDGPSRDTNGRFIPRTQPPTTPAAELPDHTTVVAAWAA